MLVGSTETQKTKSEKGQEETIRIQMPENTNIETWRRKKLFQNSNSPY